MGAGGEGYLALDRIAAATAATAGAMARPRPNPNVTGAVGVKANTPRRHLPILNDYYEGRYGASLIR